MLDGSFEESMDVETVFLGEFNGDALPHTNNNAVSGEFGAFQP
jgi:hypothetical protein